MVLRRQGRNWALLPLLVFQSRKRGDKVEKKPQSSGGSVKGKISKDELKDKIRGVILAAACGNSLGGSAIGLNHKEILATAGSSLRDFVPGLTRSVLPDHKAGEWLPESYLAIELAESLAASGGKYNRADLKERYVSLLSNEPFLASGPGAQLLKGLRRMADGVAPPDKSAGALHVSAASRAFPCACLPDTDEGTRVADTAVEQAALTHLDKRVYAAAAVLSDSVGFFVRGNKLDTEDQVREYVRREHALAEKIDPRFAEAWDDVAPDLDYMNPAAQLPYSLLNIGHEVNELVPTAVGIFLIFRHNLEEAICHAAVAGGETDTLGIIVGALAGGYHGASQIPERWLEKIANRERLEDVAEKLFDMWP
ncbi:MAG: hypothetical protein C0507_19475 [Cyanobacteria bacterium PR.3.49]|nr:hypothetical protein [Cyanobacteria bacterium PR.3.49]